jgi:hypothetical protein
VGRGKTSCTCSLCSATFVPGDASFFRHFPSLPTSLARLFCPSKFHCCTVLAMLGPVCFPFQWGFGLQVPVQTEYRNKAVFVSRHRSTSEHARPAPIAGQKRRCILPSSTTTHQKDHLCKSPGEQPALAAQPTKGPTITHPWTPTPARSAACHISPPSAARNFSYPSFLFTIIDRHRHNSRTLGSLYLLITSFICCLPFVSPTCLSRRLVPNLTSAINSLAQRIYVGRQYSAYSSHF